MLEKLQAVEDKYRELESLISDPEVMADMTKWQAYTKEHAALTPIVTEFRRYKEVVKGIEEAKSMLGEALDHEMHAFVEGELADLMEKKEQLDKKLPILLLPKDPNDEKNVIVEIRGGVGGEEAALFAGDLFRMYSHYAEKKGWKVELMDANPTEIGGFKEVTFMVTGSGAYSYLKYESGTHRVQRVPVTESGGRRRRLSPCCRRLGTSMSPSILRTCASTRIARRARVASTSTARRRPSASRICRRASSCSARTRSRSSRTRRRR